MLARFSRTRNSFGFRTLLFILFCSTAAHSRSPFNTLAEPAEAFDPAKALDPYDPAITLAVCLRRKSFNSETSLPARHQSPGLPFTPPDYSPRAEDLARSESNASTAGDVTSPLSATAAITVDSKAPTAPLQARDSSPPTPDPGLGGPVPLTRPYGSLPRGRVQIPPL